MRKILIRRAIFLPAAMLLLLLFPYTSLAQSTQSSTQQTTDSSKNKPGDASKTAPKNPPHKATDADALKPERMSTRGLHKGGKDKSGKQGGESSDQSGSSTKPDSQK